MIVDTREATTPFFREFTRRYRVEYTTDVLPFDYLFQIGQRLLAVERKGIDDFANSLYSGRLMDQVSRAVTALDNIVYVVMVHGSLYESTKVRHNNPFVLMSAIASLYAGWGVSVLLLPGKSYPAMMLYALYKKATGQKVGIKLRHGARPGDLSEQAAYFLCGLPHIGPKTARDLLTRYTALEAVNRLASEPILPESYIKDIRDVLGFRK